MQWDLELKKSFRMVKSCHGKELHCLRETWVSVGYVDNSDNRSRDAESDVSRAWLHKHAICPSAREDGNMQLRSVTGQL